MARPITIFTGQFADWPLEVFAEKASNWAYDGLELACWGDHFEVDKALEDDGYVAEKRQLLEKYDLSCSVISTHLVSQAVCDDPIDARHKGVLPPEIWGDGEPEGIRQRAEEEVKKTAHAAAKFGADTVVGFTGSSIFHMFAGWPPVSEEMIERGFSDFAERWNRIIDVFDDVGVRFAFEVHPAEIAYDFWTTQRALQAIDNRPGFGLNFDPSHLEWQFVDSPSFIHEFADRIYHVHMKDTRRTLNGRNGILSSHFESGDLRRGWDFISVGHGDVPFEGIVRMLNQIGYQGPLSVEWEDAGMNREFGAEEALKILRELSFEKAEASWDAAFATEE
jgi:sugar phosphate isomerase/epimerase